MALTTLCSSDQGRCPTDQAFNVTRALYSSLHGEEADQGREYTIVYVAAIKGGVQLTWHTVVGDTVLHY